MMLPDILTALYYDLLPTLLQAISVILGIVLMRVAGVAKARWGIEIEARHREALHSALVTGISMALRRQMSPTDAVGAAIQYARRSVPDAFEALAPAPDVLADLATAKLREAVPYVTGVDWAKGVNGGGAK